MTLYVVGTPIGNLQDITLRAIQALKEVDTIYAEDTRRTGILLQHLEIAKPLVSLHEHSTKEKIDRAVIELQHGKTAAFVTDAGTPGVADPGGKLVASCRDAGVAVVPIPGVSAITTLLSVAGVPASEFWFAGFLPTKKGRQTLMKKIVTFEGTVVLFETAPRLKRFFAELEELGGGKKRLIIGRELTKKFEEILAGSVTELSGQLSEREIKGEITIVVH